VAPKKTSTAKVESNNKKETIKSSENTVIAKESNVASEDG
jgi:hypothetical protein